jgi:hypothetical protein
VVGTEELVAQTLDLIGRTLLRLAEVDRARETLHQAIAADKPNGVRGTHSVTCADWGGSSVWVEN